MYDLSDPGTENVSLKAEIFTCLDSFRGPEIFGMYHVARHCQKGYEAKEASMVEMSEKHLLLSHEVESDGE